jgi:hypothetical protein
MAAEKMGAGAADEMRKEIESLRAKVVELEDKLNKLHAIDGPWADLRKAFTALGAQAAPPQGAGGKKAAEVAGAAAGAVHGPRHCYVLVPLVKVPHDLPFDTAILFGGLGESGR